MSITGCREALRLAALAALVMLNAGCTGPNFHRPEAPKSAGYAPSSLPTETASAAGVSGGESQHFAPASDIRWQWWTLFESPALNELIEQAFRKNPNIPNAQAALRQAQELVAA